MLTNLAETFEIIGSSIQLHIFLILGLLGLLWLIQIFNSASHYRLNRFGIYPRNIHGLIGILASPFLHGSYTHLLFNSIPLFILSALILVNGTTLFIGVSLIITILSGFGVWLFGRKAFHVGASSVIMGYWGFLLFNIYQQPSVMSIILGLLCLYYLGSLVLSLFPTEEKVSWEGHVFGFLAGLFTSYWITHPTQLLIFIFNLLPKLN